MQIDKYETKLYKHFGPTMNNFSYSLQVLNIVVCLDWNRACLIVFFLVPPGPASSPGCWEPLI